MIRHDRTDESATRVADHGVIVGSRVARESRPERGEEFWKHFRDLRREVVAVGSLKRQW